MFRKQEQNLQRGDLLAILSICFIATTAIVYIGMLTVKRAGGLLPWEVFFLEEDKK